MKLPDLAIARVIQGLPEPTLLVEPEGTIAAANPEAARLFERRTPELIGTRLDSLLADEPDRLLRYLRLSMRTTAATPGGFRIRTPSEQVITCKTLSGLLLREDHHPALLWIRLVPRESANSQFRALNERIRGLIEETKILRQAEERVRQGEERFRLLVEVIEDYAIYMLDREGHVVSWNTGAERIKGYTAEEAIGQHFSIFYPEEDRELEKLERLLKAAAEFGRIENEHWLVRKDGSRFWANVILTAIKDAQGRLIGFSKVTRDLTERKHAEDALRLQVELLQGMPAAAWTITAEGAADFANQQWLEYAGQTIEYVRSAPEAWMTALHPDDREPAARMFWNGIRSGQGFTMEARFRRASDGAYRWHLNRAVPVRDADGTVVKFVGTSTDIEELKRTEEELRRSEHRTRVIVDTALDALITMDAGGTITGWNAQAENIFGWTREEAMGRLLATTIIPEKYRDAHERGLRHFLNTGEGPILSRRIEVDALHRNGREFPAELTVTAVRLGADWSFSSFVRDITERKRADEKIRESERNLRLMTETIPEMLWSASADGAVDYCNARVLEYTGLSEKETRGAGWMKAVHSDDADAMGAAWMSSVASGEPFRFEFRGLRAQDRAYRWCVSSALPLLDAQGHISKWYGTVVDLHDWRQAEEALRRTQTELARAGRALTMGALTASVAHEVNQPLAAIVASGDSCLAWLSSEPPNLGKARAAADRITHAAAQASEVVQRIRALFQKTAPALVTLNINDAIEQIVSLAHHEAERHNVAVRKDLAAGLPAVRGDRVQLQQVILNLMINGMDAMANVHDRPRQLLVRSAKLPNNEVAVAVTDSGTGIEPAHMPRLFESFFTTKPEGIGVGLSISRSIIEAHGGRLWATRNELHGATFHFSLPVESKATGD